LSCHERIETAWDGESQLREPKNLLRTAQKTPIPTRREWSKTIREHFSRMKFFTINREDVVDLEFYKPHQTRKYLWSFVDGGGAQGV